MDEGSIVKLNTLAQQFTQKQYDVATLNSEDITWLSTVMQAKHEAWLSVAAELTADELKPAIQLLTVIEQEKSLGLAERSPVIVLFKQYKKMAGINRELVQWVKEHSENKFLPFGPIM
jgi:hypothetical protein